MSDQSSLPPLPPVPPVTAAPRGKGLRIALAVSVALNLAVLGMVAGAALHGGGMMGWRDGVRELGFGPFTEALDRDQRDALRRAFFAKAPDFRNARQAMRVDTQALLTALRAEPFDPAALSAIMEAQRQRLIGQLDLGQGLMRDFLIAMAPEARHAFADRLEQRLQHSGGDKPAP
jgi:Spy/CpxP family protein refolding chaperone